MGTFQELTPDEQFDERVRIAREMDPGEKFLMGPRLFEAACADLAARIRQHFPQATERQAQGLVSEVVEWMRRQGRQ